MKSNTNSCCSHQTEFDLVQVKGTWTRQTERCRAEQGKLSDAKIKEEEEESAMKSKAASKKEYTSRHPEGTDKCVEDMSSVTKLHQALSRAVRSKDSGQLVQSRVQTKHGEAAFSCYAANKWNKLPVEIKLSPNEDIFKSSYENKSDHGVSWTVVSPIVFTYKVIQCKDILDPRNDTLLWGHIGDEETKGTLTDSEPVKRFVIMDETVHRLYGSQVAQYFEAREVVHRILPLPTTEENKRMELVTKILEEVHEFCIDRRSEPIIAIGGGVCLDVVGLAASLYRRRTPYIRVPTTLLSYVDASVGAKTGVNFAGGKNKLGSYVPPVATFLDCSFFQTLPIRQISNGLAEMLKMALMKHRGLFQLLEADGRKLLHAKLQSCRTSNSSELEDSATASIRIAIETLLEELAPNLWEDDLDRLVDFGHLISPELEMRVLPELLHGEAVNIDMSFMVYLAHQKGLLTGAEKERIIQCMLGLELPVWHQDCTLDLVRKSLKQRLKHSAGSLRMPLPTGLGSAEIFHDVIEDCVLCQAYQKWTDELSSSGNK